MNWIPPHDRWPMLSLLGALLLCVVAMHSGWSVDGVSGGFHPGHVWVVDQVAEMLSGSESWSGMTRRIGFPEPVHLRLIGWVPLLLAAPLALIIGAPAAMWVVIVLGFCAAGIVTTVLIRRVTGADTWSAASAGLVYVLSPFSLGVLANGQLAKMQLWCLPLLLLMADCLLREERKLPHACGVFLAAVALGFTSPSIGLVMPLALGVWVVFRARWRGGGWRWAVCALGLAALGMLPAWWMHTVPTDVVAGLLPAAPVPGLQSPAHLSPVATASGLLGLSIPWDAARSAINNVATLGWPALLGGALALLLRPRHALLGLGLFVAGTLLALGPSVDWASMTWLLPAELLVRAGYPLEQSGMYYRFVQVASLGLAICCAVTALRWPSQARWIALVLGLGTAVDGWRVTEPLWPRSIRPIAHRPLYASMAADGVSGAVLELPLSHIDTEGERRLLGQLIHGRPTSVLARNMVVHGQARLERLSAAVRDARTQERLSSLGFRYVLLHRPRSHREMYSLLTDRLGTPKEDGGLAVWVVRQ
jgi:hypothetical protein